MVVLFFARFSFQTLVCGKMTDKFIDLDKVFKTKNPKLYKWLPRFILNYVKRIVHQEEINDFMVLHGKDNAFEFCHAVIKKFNVKAVVNGLENIPQNGGVILAANHPLGGFDGMTMVTLIGERRKDVSFIVNDLLLNIQPLQEIFTGVNKHGKNASESLQNINALFASDRALFVFPAGMVSRRINGKVTDLKWQKTFVTRARKHNKPIIPIHVDGHLSNWFYNLSNGRKKLGIKANIEMLYLSDEMFKQQDRTITFNIGKPIMPDTFTGKGNDQHWADEVRKEVYRLGGEK